MNSQTQIRKICPIEAEDIQNRVMFGGKKEKKEKNFSERSK
jgi:hypothetical protein